MRVKFQSELHAFLVFMGLWLFILTVCWGVLCAPSVLGTLKSERPPWAEKDDDPELRNAHLELVAAAIEEATSDPWERALLMSVGWHESKFSRAVCEGHQKGDHGRAYGCWQSWEEDRSGGIPGQAKRAMAHLRAGYRHCGDWKGAVSLYATGKGCDWVGSGSRIAKALAYQRGGR